MADSKPTERHIAPRVDAIGSVEWRSTMTAPDNSVAVINMVSDRLIPIVFVKAGHEPAYRESMPARRFTLRAIVQIAREVENTSLAYKK